MGRIEALLPALMGKSAFYYLGWYAVFRLLSEGNPEARSTRADIAFALLVATINFLSDSSVSWMSATLAGLFLLATSHGDRKINAAAAVLLALSFNGMWGPLLFDVLAIYLLRADAALVGTVLTLTQPGATWHDTIVGVSSGHSVFIYSPCSSFHNISLGLLCWVALTKLVRTRWVRQDIHVAVAVCATVILLNASRLYLMALSPDYFTYWHDGFGQQVFTWATTLAVLLISLWGAVRAGRAA